MCCCVLGPTLPRSFLVWAALLPGGCLLPAPTCGYTLSWAFKLVIPLFCSTAAGDADRAEELLLSSSCPAAAIDMRKQLGQWERALELAEQLEPLAVGSLALLRAQALEAEGQVDAALAAYQQALEAPDLSAAAAGDSAAGATAAADCWAGVARCSILAGEAERGMAVAAGSGSRELLLECAELLEGQQQAMQVRRVPLNWWVQLPAC